MLVGRIAGQIAGRIVRPLAARGPQARRRPARAGPAAVAIAALLSIGGCATLQPPVLQGTPGVETWEGRFAATVTPSDGGTPQRNTGRFSLSATANATELELLSPLGATVLRARVDPQGATMSTADGKRWQAASAQALTEQAIGWRVPVDSLPSWLRGRVHETLRSAAGPDGAERLALGREDGWEIGIDQWGPQRPQRLTLSWPAPGAAPAPALPGAAAPPAAVQLRLIVDDPGLTPMTAPTELAGLSAPAKLNLFLHVTGRRADGYHLLETVFELIDLADRIDLRLLPGGEVRLATPLPGVPPDADLTVRAARLLQARTGCRLGVEIGLDKRIPMGGGLGGGSSDAATVLLGLNRLWNLALPNETLREIGLALGADVPFFVFGRTAYATGVGEVLEALPLPPRRYLLVAPPVSVPTPEVFRAPELTRDTKPLKIDGLSRGRSVFRGRNDLQPVVVARHPQVAAALEALGRVAAGAGLPASLSRMSGSGACVFLPLDDDLDAGMQERLLTQLQAQAVGRAFLVRSLAHHPLSR